MLVTYITSEYPRVCQLEVSTTWRTTEWTCNSYLESKLRLFEDAYSRRLWSLVYIRQNMLDSRDRKNTQEKKYRTLHKRSLSKINILSLVPQIPENRAFVTILRYDLAARRLREAFLYVIARIKKTDHDDPDR